MKLHPEGRNTLILGFLLLAGAFIVSLVLTVPFGLQLTIIVPFLVLQLLFIWFFRVPYRIPNLDETLVIAPADGKVVVVETTTEQEYFRDERIQISIFMSPLNVHQNVFPVSGQVVYKKHHKGKYLVAWHPKSSTENERTTVVVRQANGRDILIRQIAGAVARRICNYSETGQEVSQCSEMGFIKFGSRVDVFLPPDTQIRCKAGETVRNRQSVLANFNIRS